MSQFPPTSWVVFISHSGIDTWVAQQIAREIEACGAVPFLDEANIAVGEDFEDRIRGALHEAKELLVLLTPWSLTRPYVWAEIGAAWMRNIPIVGVLHGLTAGDLQSNPMVPVFFKARDLIELNDIQTYFGQLRRRVAESHA